MTPEGKAKHKSKQWLVTNLPGMWFVAPRGGPFGKAGCPDWLICWMGVFIAIEVKSEVGEATALQLVQLKLIKDAGGVAAITRGFDPVRLQAIKDAALRINRGRM
jgi:hypothetical protein